MSTWALVLQTRTQRRKSASKFQPELLYRYEVEAHEIEESEEDTEISVASQDINSEDDESNEDSDEDLESEESEDEQEAEEDSES